MTVKKGGGSAAEVDTIKYPPGKGKIRVYEAPTMYVLGAANIGQRLGLSYLLWADLRHSQPHFTDKETGSIN